VISSAGTFFDVSNNNFTITLATNDFTLSSTPSTLSVCQGSDAVYTINTSQLGTFTDPITLAVPTVPGGGTASFSANPVNPGQSSTLTLSGVAAGVYTIDVTGTSTTGTKTTQIDLTVSTANPSAVSLTSPSNGATGVANPSSMSWTSAGAGNNYDIDVASDAGFVSIVQSVTAHPSTSLTSQLLSPNTQYHWRVRATNSCGQSAYTSASFTTGSCFTISATDLPLAISAADTNSIYSVINVGATGYVSDVNVRNLEGTHTWMEDLSFTLRSPNGTPVSLFANICTSSDNFNLDLDDQAASATIPCPPTTGMAYQPAGSLSDFNNLQAQGNWTLHVFDNYNEDGGSLDNWELEICVTANPCIMPTTPVVSGPNNICLGETATLTLSGTLNDATTWQWYTGTCGGTPVGTGTSLVVSPGSATTYYARGTGGCVSNALCGTKTLGVTSINTTVNQSGANLSAVQNGAQYQWLDCGNNYAVIPNATSQSYHPSAISGSYAVQITLNGCVDTSSCRTVNQAGLDDADLLVMQLYPNPGEGDFTLSWEGSSQVSQIQIFDARGRLIEERSISQEKAAQFDLRDQPMAVYYINITHAYGVRVLKWTKQ